VKFIIFQSLGGLGLFLFGMKIMSEGLQKIAGKKMRQILAMVSNNRFVGCAVGALVTSIVQSSSATTVMLVSFVNAGLMTLVQATGVILGANIGTTVTAQLIAFKITSYALPAIAIGVLLKFFIGRRKWIYVGDAILGFGLVFYGLATMKAGFAPLKGNETFINLFTQFNADNMVSILLCVLVGSALTMLLQSSSATVGITMALASQGMLTFEASVALILGDNIGTTITAEIASIGANINAHRAARAHTLFNVIGVLNVALFFPWFIKLVTWSTGTFLEMGSPDLVVGGNKPNIARYIANAHTMFNVVNAVFFLLVLPYLVKVAIFLTPQKKEEGEIEELYHIKYLDFRQIHTPAVALAQARAETVRMGEAVQLMYEEVIGALKNKDIKKLSNWRKREEAIDILQKEITQFLVQVIQRPIDPDESREVTSMMRMVNNLERIGDSIENIAELIEELIEQNLQLSEGSLKEYNEIAEEARKFLTFIIDSIMTDDKEVMEKAHAIEENIDRMREEMRGNYLLRLQGGVCYVDPGLIFVDMLTAFEKIGDYCYNIAQAVAGLK